MKLSHPIAAVTTTAIVVGVLFGCRSGAALEPGSPPAATVVDVAPTAAAAPSPATEPVAAPASAGDEYTALSIGLMTCEGCAWQVTDALSKLEGVGQVRVDLKGKCAAVQYTAGGAAPQAFVAVVQGLGYTASDLGPTALVTDSRGAMGCAAP